MKHAPSYETPALREFSEVLRARRTVNLYLQTPVPEALVMDAIESASWAPNHHVTEPWHFYLLGAKTISRCLDLCHTMVAEKRDVAAADFKRDNWSEKPGWLVVTCARNDDVLRQQEDYAACAAAIQNLMLHLWKAGVASKWTSGDITRDPRFLDILGIDGNQAFVAGLIWYGYAKLTPTQSRKPLAEVMTALG